MDKAYDSQAIRHFLETLGVEAVIPPRSNRTEAITYDKEKYKLREKVERFFNKLKQFRRIATRYEKLSRTFLAFIHLVSDDAAVIRQHGLDQPYIRYRILKMESEHLNFTEHSTDNTAQQRSDDVISMLNHCGADCVHDNDENEGNEYFG